MPKSFSDLLREARTEIREVSPAEVDLPGEGTYGIRLVGTDAFGWDAPFSYTVKRYNETGDASIIWEGHKAGRDIGYCHLEKLHNLESLPANGFTVSCFPVKVKGGSAGWTRAVAILEE